jgi:hypothetical protein
MTHVTDEQLGKIARQQADLFRRVREVSLNVEYVSRRLQEIIENKPAGNTYPLSVDYGRSVEDGVKAGRYDWVNPDITSKNFPTKRKGTAKVAVELIRFNRYISTDEALRELNRMGYRPAKLHVLLAFGEKYQEFQREFPVVALGSVWRRGWSGYRSIPCLNKLGSERSMELELFVGDWSEVCRFMAVRK